MSLSFPWHISVVQALNNTLYFVEAGDTVAVRFAIPYRCKFGQHLRVVGGCDDLGNWDLKEALTMTWTDGDVWTAELALPARSELI